jgi:hypothetical protein
LKQHNYHMTITVKLDYSKHKVDKDFNRQFYLEPINCEPNIRQNRQNLTWIVKIWETIKMRVELHRCTQCCRSGSGLDPHWIRIQERKSSLKKQKKNNFNVLKRLMFLVKGWRLLRELGSLIWRSRMNIHMYVVVISPCSSTGSFFN